MSLLFYFIMNNNSLSQIEGIGTKTLEKYEKINIKSIDDLLYFFPRDYVVYPNYSSYDELSEEYIFAVKGIIDFRPINRKGKSKTLTIAKLRVDNRFIYLKWFNSMYIASTITLKKEICVYGKIKKNNNTFEIIHPTIFDLDTYSNMIGKFYPVYKHVNGLTNNQISKNIKYALNTYEYNKENKLKEYALKADIDIEGIDIIKNIHFPLSKEYLELSKKYLSFCEIFEFLFRLKNNKNIKIENSYSDIDFSIIDKLKDNLEFELTSSQVKTINQIISDMTSSYTMSRLIQGDVGSGKTIIVFLIAIACALSGYQVLIMTPTQILSTQHFNNLIKLLERLELDIECDLLINSIKESSKKEILSRIKDGTSKIIIGTSSLISENIEYYNVALVVSDEQHKFGVNQRLKLTKKGKQPHSLIMSATPIPRTMALILYANMNISIIDEKPKERVEIKSYQISNKKRYDMYNFILEHIKNNEQCYIVCPMVEDSEFFDGENVEDYSKKLKKYYKNDVRIEVVHGQMKKEKRDEVYKKFLEKKIDILVATTVIEVGIDVQNATIMVVENAEKFGLATLHQLRGRVGRGNKQSYCFFVNGKNKKNERLDIISKNSNGFEIANLDLKLRGPGSMLGFRQSGLLEFEYTDIYKDASIIEKTKKIVDSVDDENLFNNKELLNGIDNTSYYHLIL